MDPVIAFIAVTTVDDGIVQMVGKLDALMNELYPPESAHLTPPEELSAGDNRFFAVKVDGKLMGCGAIRVVGQGYAEIKRIYVGPSSRGLGPDGEFDIEIAGKLFRASGGDIAFVLRRTVHAFKNVGSGPGRLRYAFTPASDSEAMFKAFFDAAQADNLVPERMAEIAARYDQEFVEPPL